MSFYHGIRKQTLGTSMTIPATAGSGIPFVVGTAPVHTAAGKVNEPVLAESFAEAVTALGYSDDWRKYTLCEMIYAHFNLYRMGPVVFVNVLDPQKHREAVPEKEYDVENGQVRLPLEALADTVTVKAVGEDGKTYQKDTDFVLLYDDTGLVVELLACGSAKDEKKLSISCSTVKPDAVTKTDIIGGFNTQTYQRTGMELLDDAFAKYGIIPDLLLAPGFSHDPDVAAVMSAKASSISSLFTGRALIDGADALKHFSQVSDWKTENGITDPEQILCWPRCRRGERIFHMSVHAAGLMAAVDAGNNCPSESPSNKSLQIDGLCLADGSEVVLDISGANALNAKGVVTALNFSGWVLWGNMTACYPENADVKDYFIPVARMMDWIGNSILLSTWSRVDSPLNRRLIDSMTDSLNIWLNGLTAEEKILGGRVAFLDEENPDDALLAGRIQYHVYVTPPPPAQDIDFVLEYDTSYLAALFG